MRAERRRRSALFLAAPLALLLTPPVGAWVARAHARIGEEAVRALPDSMPPFFRAGAIEVGKSAVDPDFYRLRDLPQLRNAESPEHYLDVELLEGAEWPPTRSRFLALLAERELDVYQVGTLPYSLAEAVQKLAASFAQVRLDPRDPWARARALHHAGIMAHYSADLCQPLHTTIHFNGRARPDGSSPASGIHHRMDALAEAVFEGGLTEVGSVEGLDEIVAAIRREFEASHAEVDRVYELESGLGPEEVSEAALALGRERVAASIRFTASLFVTAWKLSGEISLPGWFREIDGPASPPAGTP